MSKKEMALNASQSNLEKSLVVRSVEFLVALYSWALGEDISVKQMLHLLNFQLAVFALLLPVCAHPLYYVIALAWLASAWCGCKHALSNLLHED